MEKGILGLPRRYTKDQCFEIAKTFKSREEWKKGHPASYKCARLAGWYSECVESLPKLTGKSNTISKCQALARQYKTIGDWRKFSPSSYTYASRKRWISECCEHMVHSTREHSIEKDILRMVKAQIPSAKTARFKVEEVQYLAKTFELDIYIPTLNKGIEFDGKYWHSQTALEKRFPKWTKKEVSQYHEIKDSFFASIGISVLHIKEEDWLSNRSAQISKMFNFIGERNAKHIS
jgi:hypothetical protein